MVNTIKVPFRFVEITTRDMNEIKSCLTVFGEVTGPFKIGKYYNFYLFTTLETDKECGDIKIKLTTILNMVGFKGKLEKY